MFAAEYLAGINCRYVC